MHRYEMSGALSGLQRVRGMTLNDAHIFVRPDQIKEEFIRTVRLIQEVYEDFGLEQYSFPSFLWSRSFASSRRRRCSSSSAFLKKAVP